MSILEIIIQPLMQHLRLTRERRISKRNFCSFMSAQAKIYKNAPLSAQDTYMTFILLDRAPRLTQDSEYSLQRITELKEIEHLYEKSADQFLAPQRQAIKSAIDAASEINLAIASFDDADVRIKTKKDTARQLVIWWCYVFFMFNKFGIRDLDFQPSNFNTRDLNANIRAQLGITLDEDDLFERGLAKRGITINK